MLSALKPSLSANVLEKPQLIRRSSTASIKSEAPLIQEEKEVSLDAKAAYGSKASIVKLLLDLM